MCERWSNDFFSKWLVRCKKSMVSSWYACVCVWKRWDEMRWDEIRSDQMVRVIKTERKLHMQYCNNVTIEMIYLLLFIVDLQYYASQLYWILLVRPCNERTISLSLSFSRYDGDDENGNDDGFSVWLEATNYWYSRSGMEWYGMIRW